MAKPLHICCFASFLWEVRLAQRPWHEVREGIPVSRLIVGERVSQAPNDKQELVASVAAIGQPVESVGAVLTDSGFYSEAAIQTVERTGEGHPTATIVYAAVEKK